MSRVVINVCHGGFGLSEAAYEKLAEWGVPIRRHIPQVLGDDGRWAPEPLNSGEVIFDRTLTPRGESKISDLWLKDRATGKPDFMGRYWDTWLNENRSHPLLLRVVDELGEKANGRLAELKIVDVPDDVDWEIEEYDGAEWVAEKHRTWS